LNEESLIFYPLKEIKPRILKFDGKMDEHRDSFVHNHHLKTLGAILKSSNQLEALSINLKGYVFSFLLEMTFKNFYEG